jgi:hypothetical protein
MPVGFEARLRLYSLAAGDFVGTAVRIAGEVPG